ncbi:hypothetical protein [Streptomyces sp. 4F14]|uniref:hypothetical protein n=1 Tax=Streptomyces sp. 4F14 TaxID=3394380 RepID=UPI003A84B918
MHVHTDPSARRPMWYALVTPDGELTVGDEPYHDIRAQLGDRSEGETGHGFLRGLHPVTAYFHAPYHDDDRRMNKVADGMFWELSGPVPPGPDAPYADDDFTPEDRVIKLRGPVAFIDRHNWGLGREHLDALRTVHETVARRLRRRGWL